MIRIQHVSGSQAGESLTCDETHLRIGRDPSCDVLFAGDRETKVSGYHAELSFDAGSWFVIDAGSTNGTLVAGRKIRKCKLRSGDEIQIGLGGPVIRVEFGEAKKTQAREEPLKTEAVSLAKMMKTDSATLVEQPLATIVEQPRSHPRPASRPNLVAPAAPAEPAVEPPRAHAPERRIDNTTQMANIAGELKMSADTQTANLAGLAAKRVADARANAGGGSSGATMMIMADALKQVQQGTKSRTKKLWVKVVVAVAASAAIATSIMGVVIIQQHHQITELLSRKKKLDKEIETLQRQMQDETDPDKLAVLELRLAALTGKAESTLSALDKADKEKAAAAEGDQLDRDIRAILVKFDASTYAVPPIFKDALQRHLDELSQSSNLKFIYKRKLKYWPIILKQFQALGLPEEMAYIAWAETQFDPTAKSSAGAAGLWQLTASTARSFDLRVDEKVDERFDPNKETHAAARYLANLLAEFGSDSFMLAMASYNRGESGVRRVLHEIAQQPGGFRKEKRDFWHLYRLHLLPEETREYVPKVIAAAIVCNNPKRYGLESEAAQE